MKMATPAVVDGLKDARARASEAMAVMDGILDTHGLAVGSRALATSNVLGGVVAGLSLWHAVMPSLDEAFALVPHHTFFSPVVFMPVPFFWNVATAHFFEGNLLKAILVTPCVVALASMLERLWSSRAMAMHLGVTTALTGLAALVLQIISLYRTQRERIFFEPLRGCAGLLVALAVGLRHAYPFEALPLLPRQWGVQCQHLPFCLTCFFVLVGLLMPTWLPEWQFAPLALFFGWLHLRYLMWFPYAEAHGDHSLEFCFSALFPRPLRPFVACVGEIVHSCSVAVAPGFAKLREADTVLGQNLMYDPAQVLAGEDCNGLPLSGDATLPGRGGVVAGPPEAGAAREEYNARRAKALALLDENISSLLGGGKIGRKKDDREAVSPSAAPEDADVDGEDWDKDM